MGNSNFPTHFDGQTVNPEAAVPGRLPVKIEYGTCSFVIGEQEVVIINAPEHKGDDPLEWREPLSAYHHIRHWVVGEQVENIKSGGWLSRLFGKKSVEIEDGRSYLVVALVHGDEPWMSIILHSRTVDRRENIDDIDGFKKAYGDLLGVSVFGG